VKTYTQWNHRRVDHPLRPLGDEFKDFVRESKTIVLQQNGQTVTFGDRHGKNVGMRLRRDGLKLVATRDGKEIIETIRSKDEFPKGLAFLRKMT